MLEFARGVGGFLAGHGEPYRIEFVGDGKPVAGLFIVHSVETPFGTTFWIEPTVDLCFPAHTSIQTSRTSSTAISALRVGDVVLAFDARADKGRGALVPRRVSRLYRNTTTDWLRLRWQGGTREVITTPGHHFLDAFGGFPTTLEMVKEGRARDVLASGEMTGVTAERMTSDMAAITKPRPKGPALQAFMALGRLWQARDAFPHDPVDATLPKLNWPTWPIARRRHKGPAGPRHPYDDRRMLRPRQRHPATTPLRRDFR